MTDKVICPKCGQSNPGGAGDCENCGITFNIYETEKSRAEEERMRAEAEERARIENEAQERLRRQLLVPCPKCSHLNDPLSADCLKCGIVFNKYYDSMKIELAEDPDKTGELAALEDAIARHESMKAKRHQDMEEEARHKKAEERRRLEELRKERERQEKLKKEKEEQDRLERERKEALRREAEEQARIEHERQEALRKEKAAQQRAERERQEALKREAEAQARQERERQEKLKKEKEAQARAEREHQEALQRAADEQARIEGERQEALRREQAQKAQKERERLEALEREAAEKIRQESLWREAEENARQAAILEEAAARQQSEEDRLKEEARRMEILSQLVKPKGTLKKLLKTYSDQLIGMNYDNPTMVKEVKLASVNDDHISVLAETEGLVYTFPLTAILSIIEGVDGVTAGSAKSQTTFALIIRVSHRTI